MELDKHGAELLFQVLTEREEKNSVDTASMNSYFTRTESSSISSVVSDDNGERSPRGSMPSVLLDTLLRSPFRRSRRIRGARRRVPNSSAGMDPPE